MGLNDACVPGASELITYLEKHKELELDEEY